MLQKRSRETEELGDQPTSTQKICRTNPIISWCESAHIGFREMLELGFDMNATNLEGNNALTYCVTRNLNDAVNMLLEAKVCDVNSSQTQTNRTALHKASEVKIITSLLNHNADPTILDNAQQSPLHDSGHSTDTLQAFYQAGARLDQRDGKGWAPIHYAALSSDRVRLISWFVSKKIDPYMKTLDDQTPEMITSFARGECDYYYHFGTSREIPQELKNYPGFETFIANISNQLDSVYLRTVLNDESLSKSAHRFVLDQISDFLSYKDVAELLCDEDLVMVVYILLKLVGRISAAMEKLFVLETDCVTRILHLLITPKEGESPGTYNVQRGVIRLLRCFCLPSKPINMTSPYFRTIAEFVEANISHEDWSNRRAALWALKILPTLANDYCNKITNLMVDSVALVRSAAVGLVEKLSNWCLALPSHVPEFCLRVNTREELYVGVIKGLFMDIPLSESNLALQAITKTVQGDQLELPNRVVEEFLKNLRENFGILSPVRFLWSAGAKFFFSLFSNAQTKELIDIAIEQLKLGVESDDYRRTFNACSILAVCPKAEANRYLPSIIQYLQSGRCFTQIAHIIGSACIAELEPYRSDLQMICTNLLSYWEKSFQVGNRIQLDRGMFNNFIVKMLHICDDVMKASACQKVIEHLDKCPQAGALLCSETRFFPKILERTIREPFTVNIEQHRKLLLHIISEISLEELYPNLAGLFELLRVEGVKQMQRIENLEAFGSDEEEKLLVQLSEALFTKVGRAFTPIVYLYPFLYWRFLTPAICEAVNVPHFFTNFTLHEHKNLPALLESVQPDKSIVLLCDEKCSDDQFLMALEFLSLNHEQGICVVLYHHLSANLLEEFCKVIPSLHYLRTIRIEYKITEEELFKLCEAAAINHSIYNVDFTPEVKHALSADFFLKVEELLTHNSTLGSVGFYKDTLKTANVVSRILRSLTRMDRVKRAK